MWGAKKGPWLIRRFPSAGLLWARPCHCCSGLCRPIGSAVCMCVFVKVDSVQHHENRQAPLPCPPPHSSKRSGCPLCVHQSMLCFHTLILNSCHRRAEYVFLHIGSQLKGSSMSSYLKSVNVSRICQWPCIVQYKNRIELSNTAIRQH